MPQEVQIIPKWLQPHVMTVINDNTQFSDEVSTVDTNTKFVAVFCSSQGIDNVFIKKTSLSDFRKTYGIEDYAKYGQPLLMPIAELTAGKATVYCMRVMPEDADYANTIISIKYKEDPDNKKFIIRFDCDYATDATSDSILDIKMMGLDTGEPDDDGFIKVPVIRVRTAGRGEYGNKYRLRIANNYDYEKDYKIKMFSFEAISAISGLSKVGTYVGSVVTSPQYNASTLINDVIDEAEVGSSYFDIRVNEENMEMIYDKFVEFLNTLPEEDRDEIPAIDEFDPFFGLKVASTALHKNLEIDTTTEGETTSLDNPEGIPLAGGDDGSFSSKVDPQVRQEAINKAYCDAFEGNIDRTILSSRRIPVDVLLDANYSYEVKGSLVALANAREDALLYLDSGILSNTSEIDNIIEDYKAFNTRNVTKDFQHYYIRDSITKKKIPVTMTYFYAQNIGQHFQNYGNHVPMVKKYAQLSGHVKNSLKPAVEVIDMELKEKLYESRFNYWEAIAEDTFQKGCQNTSQTINSDLMEENNMHVLFELKRIIEKDCHENLYNFANAEERKSFKDYEDAKFANWVGRKLYSFSIEFDMNEWEAERSILHCYIAVQFRTLNKRTIIEIDVNKRDFTA